MHRSDRRRLGWRLAALVAVGALVAAAPAMAQSPPPARKPVFPGSIPRPTAGGGLLTDGATGNWDGNGVSWNNGLGGVGAVSAWNTGVNWGTSGGGGWGSNLGAPGTWTPNIFNGGGVFPVTPGGWGGVFLPVAPFANFGGGLGGQPTGGGPDGAKTVNALGFLGNTIRVHAAPEGSWKTPWIWPQFYIQNY